MSPDKLDSKVKDSLQNMEVPFDPSGWDRLERNLDAKGSSSSFKWNWKYSLNAFIVIAASAALTWYVLYQNDTQVSQDKITPVKNNNDVVKKEKPTPQVNANTGDNNSVTETVTTPVASPVYYATWPTKPNNANTETDGNGSNPEFTDEMKKRSYIENPLMRGENLTNPIGYDNFHKKTGANGTMLSPDELSLFTSPEYLANQKTFFFGDQIDEKKGYIYNTKEKDSMRRLFFLKQQEEEELKRLEKLNKSYEKDTTAAETPVVPNDNPPRKKRDKKPTKDSKKVDSVSSEPTPDSDTPKDVIEDDKKKVEPKKNRDDKPKLDGRKTDPLNPYQN